MKILFLTPPMPNWVRWGKKHVACNPLHAHTAAFVREKNVAEVAVLDCRALELDQQQMLERIEDEAPGHRVPWHPARDGWRRRSRRP